MNDVTLEIYHYDGPFAPEITVPLQEPYIFTETFNDTVNIGSVCPSQNIYIDVHITLDLNLINTQLEGLGCPPNDFVVPGTTDKVAIVNGHKKYALSACELAALINLEASGYAGSSEDGFLVMTGDYIGSDCYLQVGNGTFNCIVDLIEGDQYFGQDCERKLVVGPKDMEWVTTGTYVCCKVPITDPPFIGGERYYVMYRAVDPITGHPEISNEDFTVLKGKGGSNLTFSFIK
jgi:hypothetical protein